jgi:hypothetical protein
MVPPFLTPTLDGCTPRSLHLEGKNPRCPLIGGWVSPRARLGAVEKKKITYSCLESNTGHPVRRPSLYGLDYTGCEFDSVKELNKIVRFVHFFINLRGTVRFLNGVPAFIFCYSFRISCHFAFNIYDM